MRTRTGEGHGDGNARRLHRGLQVQVDEEFPDTVAGRGCPVRIVAVEEQRVRDGERRAKIGVRYDWRGRPRKEEP